MSRLAGFGVLLCLVVFGVDRLVTSGLHRINSSTFGVMNSVVNGRVNAEVLISGSSRALVHFDSRIIQALTGLRTYNIGVNGAQIDMQVALLRTYLRHNEMPRLLVQSLDAFSFVTSHGGVHSPGQYMPYLDEPDLYDAIRRINPDTWKSRRLPLYRYSAGDTDLTWWTGIRGAFGWTPPEDRHLGFEPRDTEWTGDFDRLRRRNPDGVTFAVEPEGVQILEEALRFCRRLRIPVVLVYSPEYWEMQALEVNRDEVFSAFRRIAKGQGCVFWDYSSSPITQNKHYFYNSQHLNARGAAVFSSEFAARLATLTLAESR